MPEEESTGPVPFGRNPTDEEILAGIGYTPEQIAQVKSSPTYQGMSKLMGTGFNLPFLRATDPNRQDIVARLARGPVGGVAMGALDTITGLLQASQHVQGALGDRISAADSPYVDALRAYLKSDYERNVLAGQKPSLANRVARYYGAATAGSILPGSEIGRGAVGGAELGLSAPVDEPGDFAAQKAWQVGTAVPTMMAAHGLAGAVERLPSWMRLRPSPEAAHRAVEMAADPNTGYDPVPLAQQTLGAGQGSQPLLDPQTTGRIQQLRVQPTVGPQFKSAYDQMRSNTLQSLGY